MAKITLSGTLLATDLSQIPMAQSLLDFVDHVKPEITSLLIEDAAFDTIFKKSGAVYSVRNPVFTGDDAYYKFTGSQSLTFDSAGDIATISSRFSGFTATTVDGKYTAKGEFSSSVTENGGTNYTLKYTSLSFKGIDGSSWSFSGNLTTSYRKNSATQVAVTSVSDVYESFAASDGLGSSVSSKGNIIKTASSESFTGYFTELLLNVKSSSMLATSLTLSQADVADGFSFSTVKDEAATFLAANDVLTLSGKSLPVMATTEPIPGTYDSLVYAYAGDDKVTGTALGDYLCGGEWDSVAGAHKAGSGKDSLYGGGGTDSLFGADDDDLLSGGDGTDWLWGGAGNDKLLGGAGDDLLYGQDGEDACLSGTGNDSIDGGAGNDTLDGGSGDDSLLGGVGNDSIVGGTGDDYLAAGTGIDTLTGGKGSDVFAFLVSEMSATETPVVTDFQIKQDKIIIKTTVTTAYTAVTQSSFVSGANVTSATLATDIYLYDTVTGTLYYDADGTGATYSAVTVCTLTGIPVITYEHLVSLLVTS